jgi:hypothetical protein
MPDGFLFGTCSKCCDCDCSSVGFEPAIASDAERGLVWLEFSSCIGSGAAGTVDAPAAFSPCDYEAAAGPITAATLTNGGSGYAVLGRVAPTVTASVTGGSGAALSVTLSEEAEYLGDGCLEVPFWTVDGVAVTSGGSGYTDGVAVAFTAASGDTTVFSAAGRAYVDIDEPENETFTITTASGSGAVLSAVWELLPSDQWVSTRAASPCEPPPKKTYRLVSVSVTNGGSGYAQFETISIGFPSSDDGIAHEAAFIDVDTVDGSGAITAVFVAPNDGNFNAGPAGKYVGSVTDVLNAVVVNSCVSNGVGKYYREDADEPPYVATVTVTVSQEAPSTGSGASVTATVEDDTASADFGKVSALTLVDGGSGYLEPPAACTLPDTLHIDWNGNTFEVPIIAGGESVVCNNNALQNCAGGIGSTGSYALGSISGVSCKCGGRLHMTIELTFVCTECVPIDGTNFSLSERGNFLDRRVACARFEVDETGCPVGDAVIFDWQQGGRIIVSGCLAPSPHCLGCRPYEGPDGAVYTADPCICDEGCDQEFPPTISLMP